MLLVPFAAQKNNKESHVADALQEASSDRSGADEACVLPVRIRLLPVGVPAGIGTCRRVGAPIRVVCHSRVRPMHVRVQASIHCGLLLSLLELLCGAVYVRALSHPAAAVLPWCVNFVIDDLARAVNDKE